MGKLTAAKIRNIDRPGFTKEKPLKKMGQKAQDTCVLNFDGVRMPRANILGGDAGIGKGIPMQFGELVWERLMIGVLAMAGAEFCFNEALNDTRERQAFGKPVAEFQDVRFTLAEMQAKISVGQAYVDQCLAQMLDGQFGADDAAKAKDWCSEMAFEVADQAIQLHGGYGYMLKYPVARAFTDLRAHRIEQWRLLGMRVLLFGTRDHSAGGYLRAYGTAEPARHDN